MRARLLLAVLALAAGTMPLLGGTSDSSPQELDRVEKTLQVLSELKAKIASSEAEVDRLITELSEQKGALQAKKPAPFGGLVDTGSGGADPAKPKPVRCAAMTAKGERCTRGASPGSRYCKQHMLAHQK